MSTLNPYTVINPLGTSEWVLVCEHASNRVPSQLNSLGLPDSFFDEHIGHDIGAYEMTLTLSEQLDATAVICNYSRLVIDCNRTLSAGDCIPATSDGVVIPGNTNLSPEDKLFRINEIYRPFHTCVFQVLAEKLVNNPNTKLANIHSFTPMLATERQVRPWEIGFIYRDPNPTQQIMQAIREQTDYLVGDNEPYNGFTHKGYTVPAHADAQDLPSFLVEFRQDLIAQPSGVAHWSKVLLNAIADV